MTNDDADPTLIVASNRGPVSWEREGDDLRPERGAGGLVSALGEAMAGGDNTWISLALDDVDREVAHRHDGEAFEADTDRGTYRLRLLDVGDRLDPHYNVVSNRLLWFTLHELWGAPYEPSGTDWSDPWFHGYTSVNETVAGAVADAADDDSEIHLQDYHLLTAGRTIRSELPGAALLHYVHTPWVGPDYLRVLPDRITDGILRGLLAADVVGFSSPMWAEAFRRCVVDMCGADVQGETVTLDDQRTVVADFVLGVDVDTLERESDTDAVAAAGEELEAQLEGRRLLLRADRTDLSKNILRGLLAFEQLLERYPEHRQRVWHVALLNPSRQDVPEYASYLEACQEVADRIHEAFGERVLEFAVSGDYPRVLAAFQRYDVMLTNPVVDGTNLVAKEGAVLNRNAGAVVLSRTAGAAHVLGDGALLINPYDVESQVEALQRALTMDADERSQRAKALREASMRGRPADWFAAQRARLSSVVHGR
ncbi:MAG: trehalose-6-phosphate synthase [Actinobacteria bacterium]|nr:trehalose-6-phosphate synthase [Actinomycetota bacterium]